MAAQHDVVIVGGGVAGLATGALVARAGRQPIVLEKGNQLGGRAYTYVDQGFTLNYGAHAMYRPHSGLLADILRRIGRPRIEAPYPNPRRAYFAQDGRWGHLGTMPQDVLFTSLFPMATRMRLMRFMALLRFGKPDVGDLTAGAWLDRHTHDPYLKRFALALATINTYTRPSSELSAAFLLRHLQRTLFAKDYVGYMSRGWSTMYDAFASVIAEHGGEIATGSRVDKLISEGGRVVAALVGDRRIEAGAFVVTVPPQDAPKLAEAGSPLRTELERWHGLKEARAVCLDLGFSRRLREDVTFIYDVEYDLYFSLHSEVTPDLAPPGGQLLHAMAYLSQDEGANDWLAERRAHELEQGLDRYFRGWREATVVQRPLPNALVTSARQTSDQQARARVPARSSVANNLYYAGDARDLPYNLTEISLASAMEIADLIASTTPARRAEVPAGIE